MASVCFQCSKGVPTVPLRALGQHEVAYLWNITSFSVSPRVSSQGVGGGRLGGRKVPPKTGGLAHTEAGSGMINQDQGMREGAQEAQARVPSPITDLSNNHPSQPKGVSNRIHHNPG
eukprot:2484997-Amphidinium_carterae.1